MEALYGPGLVYQNATTGDVETGFAKSLTGSNGNKTWTMVLNSGLKFSGGTAFNAQAVVDNINRKAVFLALSRQGLANVWAPGNPVSTNYFPSNSPYYNPSLNWPAQDSAEAQTLFNQLAAQGTPVKFTVLWPTGTNSTTAQYVASTLNAYKNVSVQVSTVLPAQHVMELNQTQNYQMTAYGFYNSAVPGHRAGLPDWRGTQLREDRRPEAGRGHSADAGVGRPGQLQDRGRQLRAGAHVPVRRHPGPAG
jgi:ABC-type transport system substrate-binding protein